MLSSTMKIQLYKKILVTLVLLFGALAGRSQEPPDSLFSYLEIAAKNNPMVLQRFHEYEAALQKVPQAGALPDPQLSVGVFLKPMELMAGYQRADFRLMQMFPWFGVLSSAKDEMSLMAKAKFESFRNTKLQVYYDVQRSWYELHKIKQNIRVSENNMEILQTIERLAIVKFRSGPNANAAAVPGRPNSSALSKNTSSGSSSMNSMGANPASASGAVSSQGGTSMPGGMGAISGSSGLADVYRIQIEMAELQNNIELLKSQWNTVSAQFNSYLNRQPDASITIPDTLIAGSYQPSLPTLPDNPMLGMLLLEQQSLEARKKMVAKMSYPMVGLGINYLLIDKSPMSTSPMNGNDMIMPMVTATLPIYRKKYRAMKNEADLLKSATIQNYQAAANALQTEYYQATQLYQDAKRRNALYATQAKLASKSLNIMLRSYAASGTNLTDILRVQQQTIDYEYRQMEAIADYNTSIAWLKRLTVFTQ